MSKRKPGWDYIYSQELEMEIAVNKESGWVFCADGVKYSPREIDLLKKFRMHVDKATHRVKKVFEGEIFDIHNLPIKQLKPPIPEAAPNPTPDEIY